ncbi:OsmC family peroxiredoxin [Saccharopolyspora rectivirgula]|jgi:osmotically inducible protein OsmC|uniref:Peroxiredoxin n=1 Tax=Saccharopolyspora rectivirgula TaxID=28042 RepID=A0A073B208_9PSEU|nr:OsmC family peroxiredoxin [Saccharopolyspora rectivirgula]KEI45322.1 peroxiredoxin [Saccharopolyspora rectivirgula]
MAERKASTHWTGDLKTGTGNVNLDSSASGQFPVTWAARTEAPEGLTSPEELIAAALSSCYCMQLSGLLSAGGTPPSSIDASARATFGPRGEGFAITGVKLTVRAVVPGLDADAFQRTAQKAKEVCPVSVALGGTEITLDAALA